KEKDLSNVPFEEMMDEEKVLNLVKDQVASQLDNQIVNGIVTEVKKEILSSHEKTLEKWLETQEVRFNKTLEQIVCHSFFLNQRFSVTLSISCTNTSQLICRPFYLLRCFLLKPE